MPTESSTAQDPLTRAEIERVLARNVGTMPSEAEILILARNIPAYQRAILRLRHLPLPDEETATLPTGEPRL